jgi:hypothetical protein
MLKRSEQQNANPIKHQSEQRPVARTERRVACPVRGSDEVNSNRLRRTETPYPEIIWSVKSNFEERREVNTRSGNRNSDGLIIDQLSRETGRSQAMVKKLLAQGEYLTKECLAVLSKSGADEDFFDATQQVKRFLVKDMLSRGLSHKQIEGEISRAFYELWEEYQQTDKVDRKRWMVMENGVSKEKRSWKQGNEIFRKPQILKYRSPNVDGPISRPLKPKQISRRLKSLSQGISEIAQKADGKQCDLIQEVGNLLTKMIRLHHSLLRGRESTKVEKTHATLH